MMKPVVPIPKHLSNGFSIDSLIQKDNNTDIPGSSSDIATASSSIYSPLMTSETSPITGRIPPLHPALPMHVRNLLVGAGGIPGAGSESNLNPADLLALQRSASWAFQNSLTLNPALTRGLGPLSGPSYPPLYPGLMPSGPRDGAAALFPWMLTRSQPHMFGMPPFGHTDPSGLFFHPYRKPKRIRTAFSPSQLLKLEHAFEKNHYVVGQERKDLASKLNLTETQVKVWFQNRRTKFKRVRADGEPGVDDDDDDPESIEVNVTDDTEEPSDSESESHGKDT